MYFEMTVEWDVQQDFIMEGKNITEAVNKVKAHIYESHGLRGDDVRILGWQPLQEADITSNKTNGKETGNESDIGKEEDYES